MGGASAGGCIWHPYHRLSFFSTPDYNEGMNKEQMIEKMIQEYRKELESLSLAELQSHYATVRSAQRQMDWSAGGLKVVQPRPEEMN